MYFSIFMSDAKKKEESIKSGWDGALSSKSACHGEREVEQTFEKRVVKLMSNENVSRTTKSM